jgi:WD40 repeat protein
VANVTWNDCLAFCDWLARREKATYNLPTEPQWEYTCRAGTQTRYCTGDDYDELVRVGNSNHHQFDFPAHAKGPATRDGYPHSSPVGSFQPNAFGVYDMHGNAFEWTRDWMSPYRDAPCQEYPEGPPQTPPSSERKVLRGGSWVEEWNYARSAARHAGPPSERKYNFGFRVVRDTTNVPMPKPEEAASSEPETPPVTAPQLRLPYFGYQVGPESVDVIETLARHTNCLVLRNTRGPQTETMLEKARLCGMKVLLRLAKTPDGERVLELLDGYRRTAVGVVWDPPGVPPTDIDAFARKLRQRFPEALWLVCLRLYSQDVVVAEEVDGLVMWCSETTSEGARSDVKRRLPEIRIRAKGRPILLAWHSRDGLTAGKVPECQSGVFAEYVKLALEEGMSGVYFESYDQAGNTHGISSRPELVREIEQLGRELRVTGAEAPSAERPAPEPEPEESISYVVARPNVPLAELTIHGRIGTWVRRIEYGRDRGDNVHVNHTVFSPDGRYAYTGGGAGESLSKWDLHTGKEVLRFEGAHWMNRLAISADGKRLLTSGLNPQIQLWDTDQGKRLRVFSGHAPPNVPYVAFLADGRHVISGGQDGTIRVWELETGRQVHRFRAHEKGITTMDVSPDGKLAVCASGHKHKKTDYDTTYSIRLIDLGSMKEIRRLNGHGGLVDSVAFSPDGKQILSGSWDKSVRLWDVASGRQIRKMTGHRDYIRWVCFSPNGRYALSAGGGTVLRADGHAAGMTDAIHLWDLESGRAVQKFEGHKNFISSVVFHPTGQYAFSAGYLERAVFIWKLPPLR